MMGSPPSTENHHLDLGRILNMGTNNILLDKRVLVVDDEKDVLELLIEGNKNPWVRWFKRLGDTPLGLGGGG
jgi:hypothetical protein